VKDTEQGASQRDPNKLLISRAGKFDALLGRMDLIAILTTLLGVCLLGVAALVMGVIELVKLVSSLWSDSIDRWLIIVLGLTFVWVVVRWRKMSVF
jgi:hypothetical protein